MSGPDGLGIDFHRENSGFLPRKPYHHQNRNSHPKADLESHRSRLQAMMNDRHSNHLEFKNTTQTHSDSSYSPSSSMDDLPLPRMPSLVPRSQSATSMSGSSFMNDSMPSTPPQLWQPPTPPSSVEAHDEIRRNNKFLNMRGGEHRNSTNTSFEDEMDYAFSRNSPVVKVPAQISSPAPQVASVVQKPTSAYKPLLTRKNSASANAAQNQAIERAALAAISPRISNNSGTSSNSSSSLPQYSSSSDEETGKLLQSRDDPFADAKSRQSSQFTTAQSQQSSQSVGLSRQYVTPKIKRKAVVHTSSADQYSSSAATPPRKSRLPSKVKVLVLGAGPTGIGAAHQLEASGCEDWLMLDAMNRPGGMAVTEVDQHGFRWDLGGHVIHSRYEQFDKVAALHKDWVHPNRGGWVRVQDQWVPTPIQQSLGNLANGKKIIKELKGKGRGGAKPEKESKNLGEYYRNTFGKELNKTFFEPFNKKQWGWDLNDLDHTWTSLRSGSKIANVPEASEALIQLSEPKDTSKFPYPRLGTGSLWKSIAAALPAEKQRYSTTVQRIDLKNKMAILTTGETISYSRCISSIPLNIMLKLVAEDRPDLAELVPNLKHSATTVVGLGFRGPLPQVLKGKTWIFSADSEVEFHRASVTSNFSQAMSDGGNPQVGPRWSIMFETATSDHRDVDISQENLVQRHMAELQKWGAVRAGERPLSVWYKHLKMGYPLPFLGRDELLSSKTQKILPELEKSGLVSRGRFGGWRYESSNQDCAYVQGVEATNLVLKGTKEKEYWPDRPDVVDLKSLVQEEEEEKALLINEKEEELDESAVKKERRSLLRMSQVWIQANYFVTQSSPDVVLPYVPTDEEKMSFLKTYKRFVIPLGILALASSTAGLWLFALGGPAFYWFAAFCFLGQLTSAIFLLATAIGKKFDLEGHERCKQDYGVYSNEKDLPTVDLYLTCCKEPIEILDNTYGYVSKMVYPKDKINIYVLDDGAMDEVKQLADKYGFHYIVRPNRGHLKKAGNLRHAYANTNGDYFLILDADFCPRHDFLLETIPMMRKDDKLAVIQTPQYFHTDGGLGKQTWVERGAGAVQEIFYRLIMTSRNTWGAAICAGSCALYRREALKKLGGTAPLESSEDIWTGFHLIQDGWKVQYLPIVLSCGCCPDTARALFSQQIRWCEGSCSLVLSKAFWKSNFTWKQKALYLSGLLYYLDQALSPFILPLPSIFLVWIRPGKLIYYNLAFAVPTLLYSFWLNRFWSRAKHAKSIGFVNAIQSYSYFFAFKDRILNTKFVWVPTGDAKAHKSNRYRNARWICIVWTFANTSALAAGIAISWIAGHAWYDFVPIIALQAWSVHNLIPFMLAA